MEVQTDKVFKTFISFGIALSILLNCVAIFGYKSKLEVANARLMDVQRTCAVYEGEIIQLQWEIEQLLNKR